MELLEINALIAMGAIIGVGVLLAPVLQVAWTMRILIASYISLCLALLVPESFVFNVYANAIFFGSITVLFALVEQGRFFDVNEWMVGRFSFQVFVLSILSWIFIFSVLFSFLPFSLFEFGVPRSVYDVLTDYIFYFAIAPIIFSILFSRNLR